MDKIANLPAAERLQVFQNTATKKKISVAMIEKDFWVCWVLGRLFGDKELSNDLRFKGGTSLSKGYHLIERFSEDLDIILAKEKVLEKDEDWIKSSATKQDAFREEISAREAQYISTTLKDKIAAVLANTVKIYTDEEYVKVNPQYEPKEIDNKSLHVVYPKVVTEVYLRPDILLEIGIMSAWLPNEPLEIAPYIADVYPQLGLTAAIVPTIKAQRTFWDKAAILHREFYRPATTHTPARYSRHYYDLYKMALSPIKAVALADNELLADVIELRSKLRRSPWARYDLAKAGTFRLLPNDNNKDVLKRDYQAMQGMIFGDIPDWDDILAVLQALEDEINK